MIRYGNREINSIRFGNRVVSAIYLGTRLVWSAITSCFGSGWWINTAPWKEDEGWKN